MATTLSSSCNFRQCTAENRVDVFFSLEPRKDKTAPYDMTASSSHSTSSCALLFFAEIRDDRMQGAVVAALCQLLKRAAGLSNRLPFFFSSSQHRTLTTTVTPVLPLTALEENRPPASSCHLSLR